MSKIIKVLIAAIIVSALSLCVFAQSTTVTLYSQDGRNIFVSEKYVSDYNKVGWYKSFVTLYSLDGRTITVGDVLVPDYLAVGWYNEPVTTVYSQDGRWLTIPVSEIQSYNNVGWFSSFKTLYALDGRTVVVGDALVEQYKAACWYETPVSQIYALDGRSLIIPTVDLEAYKNVGWYTKKEYIDLTTKSFELNFKCVLQKPELPTGCEVTSLAAVLNYYGYDVSKTVLADGYLDKGPIGSTSPFEAFVGEPEKLSSFGCFAPVIKNCAEKYLTEQNSSLRVFDTTGVNLESLLVELVNGSPVIIWATGFMGPSFVSATWNIDGTRVDWRSNEHCMVLYGYDKNRQVVKVADPLSGCVEYPLNLFERRFKEMYMQSVIIKY